MKILYIDCFCGFDARSLLGALIDAGASAEAVEQELQKHVCSPKISVTETLRMSIEAKKASVTCTGKKDCAPFGITKKFGFADGTDDVTMQGVLCAISLMNIDYVMCSHLPVPDFADGEVISILQNFGIGLLPVNDEFCVPDKPSAAFLGSICADSGPKPYMDIISVGYGGSGNDAQGSAVLVCATIGSFNEENLIFEKEFSEVNI